MTIHTKVALGKNVHAQDHVKSKFVAQLKSHNWIKHEWIGRLLLIMMRRRLQADPADIPLHLFVPARRTEWTFAKPDQVERAADARRDSAGCCTGVQQRGTLMAGQITGGMRPQNSDRKDDPPTVI